MITPLTWALIGDYLLRFVSSALVGAILALHPARVRRHWGTTLDWTTVEGQIIVTFAGALMVIMVGESVPRAFGLLGLGSLIRFRATMNNPRDLALLLVLVALGMGCGIKLYPVVAIATAFSFILLFALDFGRRAQAGAMPPAGGGER